MDSAVIPHSPPLFTTFYHLCAYSKLFRLKKQGGRKRFLKFRTLLTFMKQPYFYEKNGLLYTKSGLNFHFQPTYLSDICFFTVLLLNLWEKFPHLALPVHPSPAGFPVPVSFQKSQETSVFLSLTRPEIFFSSAGA